MPFPLLNNSRLRLSNNLDCERSPEKYCATPAAPLPSPLRSSLIDPSGTEFENPLHRGFIGLEHVAVTGNRVHQFLQELQRGIQVLMPVKRHKTAGKQLCYGLARRKPCQHVPTPMLENENPRA